MKRRPLSLVLAGVGLFLLLGGPTPGSVGDCTAGDSFADPVQHCTDKEAWTCARRGARGEFGPPGSEAARAGEEACSQTIRSTCSGAAWPVGCEPTQQQSDACITAMMDANTLGVMGQCFPDATACGVPAMVGPGCAACDQPVECNLCGASGALTASDAGAGE